MSSNLCNHCNKEFSTKYSLIRHQKTYEIQKPEIIHKCMFCEKILKTKQRLQSHIEICKNNTNKLKSLKNIEIIYTQIKNITKTKIPGCVETQNVKTVTC